MTDIFDRLQQEIDDRERQEGMSTLDLLDMPAELSRIVVALARKGQMPVEDLAADVEMPVDELEPLMDALVDKGMVRGYDIGDRRLYRTYFGRRRGREAQSDIWSALQERTDDPTAD